MNKDSEVSKICSKEGCEREIHGKQLCHVHYVHLMQTTAPKCIVEDCEKPSRARSMCHRHYDKMLRDEAQQGIDYDDLWEFVKKQLKIGEPNGRKV